MSGIEHPEIGWAMRTGYPSWNQPQEHHIHCEECGADITHKEIYFDENHKHLCMDCLLFFHLLDY